MKALLILAGEVAQVDQGHVVHAESSWGIKFQMKSVMTKLRH
jgi:hypothetical protein